MNIFSEYVVRIYPVSTCTKWQEIKLWLFSALNGQFSRSKENRSVSIGISGLDLMNYAEKMRIWPK